MGSEIELLAGGGFYAVRDAQVLIVMLHAYDSSPASLQRMAEVGRQEYPSSDIYAPKLPVTVFSKSDPSEIAHGIVDYLGRLPRIAAYSSIILVGHSLGAVLAQGLGSGSWRNLHGDGQSQGRAAMGSQDRPDRPGGGAQPGLDGTRC